MLETTTKIMLNIASPGVAFGWWQLPAEGNPMLGFRGAARYYSDRYRAGFLLERQALKKVREEMGF